MLQGPRWFQMKCGSSLHIDDVLILSYRALDFFLKLWWKWSVKLHNVSELELLNSVYFCSEFNLVQ